MLALQAVTPAGLVQAAPEVTLAEARKLIAQVHRGEPVAASSSVRRSAAAAVQAIGNVPTLAVVDETASQLDPFVKYLCESAGDRFETVRIPLEHPDRYTVCVSSQVGCALACSFCATGRLGLTRNLAAWEIVEQVRVVRARLPATNGKDDPRSSGRPRVPQGEPSSRGVDDPGCAADRRSSGRPRVHGVVFQGMGEPLANLDAVLAAIAVMTEPCALGIDARAITVCTAGLPVGIRRLAREAPNVRLGLSMSSALAAHRKRVMPIADRHDLEDVLDAVAEHAMLTRLAPMWALTLLAGVNDSDDDARALAERAHAFHARTGKRPRISIVAYNAIGGDDPFRRSTREDAFRAVLSAARLPSHRRYSGGSDVAAACGQLAATTG
ncbi:MAG: RNA methyltransferase [Deltaproteobacteria bacterium]|nr:RNA methyltransferase [Deltaproteobacteria bacterium]